jgi:D-lactate dehydrogenase
MTLKGLLAVPPGETHDQDVNATSPDIERAYPVLARAATLLLTEADLQLVNKIREALPVIEVQALFGTLDRELISDPYAVTVLWVTVRSTVGVDEMDALPNLGLILTASAGYDHIDLKAAAARGIAVCNVPEYGPAVAEFNIASMLALSRKLHRGYLQTLQNEFSLTGLLGQNLYGKTLGVVGAGNIGLKVLELAKPFGMKLLACDPNPRGNEANRIGFEYVDLDRLLVASDVIALCCPLVEATHHMIGKAQFRRMKRGVLIVNTSRGAVIDTQALLWALNQGIVEGAALDVLEAETLLTHDGLLETLQAHASEETTSSIAEDLTLMRHPKVIVTPHMAFYTRDSLAAIQDASIGNLASWMAGAPHNVVTQ